MIQMLNGVNLRFLYGVFEKSMVYKGLLMC